MSKSDSNKNKTLKTHAAVTEGGTPLSRYQDTIVGSRSMLYTIYFEFCVWLSNVPGMVGLFLRQVFWARLFGSCGKKVVFASGIVLRNPKRIHLGSNVVISEGCILDARTPDSDVVINIKNSVMLSNSVVLSCKGGHITIGAYTGIGAQSVIQSGTDEPVQIGADVIIGPNCYITGGGNYNTDRTDMPIWRQGKKVMGGSTLSNDVWLGAKVTVLGGTGIGSGSIIGAGSVVTKDIGEMSVCVGIPAKVIKNRS